MHLLFRLLLPIALTLSVASGVFSASVRAQANFSATQQTEVENIIRNYLLQNPELILDVLKELERRQKEATAGQARDQMLQQREALLASPHDVVVNPGGAIPVVEFFDYQCGFCKRVLPAIQRLQAEAKNVRLILKEYPILGEMSVYASRVAIAAKSQDKYLAFHNAMMETRGKLDEARILDVARDVGLNIQQLRADMKRPEVQEAIDTNYALANALNIRGTPTLIIGDTLVPGAIDFARMIKLVAEAEKSCKIC